MVATVQTLTAHEAGIETTAAEAAGLSGDMFIFANRVVEKLIGSEGLSGEQFETAKKVQDGFRTSLLEVLRGKLGFSDWFNSTKTNLGLHRTKLLQTLYDAITGLKDEELKDMQEFISKALETGVM
ncbi:unnamed protein product [marine sediment metagenome]|uniref:Uncharacterized protein n=1 Tax=marine sediment metagenome TaxID=412755 RepID=X1H373_9ZZZZ